MNNFTFTSDYVLGQFAGYGSVFCSSVGELMYVMSILAMSGSLENPVSVQHELGGYTIIQVIK